MPWFTAQPRDQPDFDFSQVAGQYVVVCFLGASDPLLLEVTAAVRSRTDLLDGDFASAFIVVSGPSENLRQLPADIRGVHILRDSTGKIAQLYGVEARNTSGQPSARAMSFVLDYRLRLIQALPIENSAEFVQVLATVLSSQPPKENRPYAPLLLVPRVFEPSLCAEMIRQFHHSSTAETGFMRDDPLTGRTIQASDRGIKRRRDWILENNQLIGVVLERVSCCLIPEIQKAFQFNVTRVERCIVSCYDGNDGGHFRIHRDNMSKATAHRRFAVTINLNTGDYDGGELVFPEFSTERWSPPIGGALVFSCSLLHEVRPVARGQRYCFLPFLHDEAAEELRQRNMHMLENGTP